MFKILFVIMSVASMSLFLLTAGAEEARQASQAIATETSIEGSQNTGLQDVALMHEPVDFSSPEAVEKTLQNIHDKEGDLAYNQLKAAMQYILVYDLSLKNSKENLYKKLDGRTPEQIIAKIKR